MGTPTRLPILSHIQNIMLNITFSKAVVFSDYRSKIHFSERENKQVLTKMFRKEVFFDRLNSMIKLSDDVKKNQDWPG